MQEAGKSLRTVAYAASIISRCHWFWDNFSTGEIIHPAKKLTAKSAAMEDISVLLHCPMEVWRRHNCVLQLYAVLLHEYRAAGLRVVGWKTPQCYLPVVLFPRERPDCFLKSNEMNNAESTYAISHCFTQRQKSGKMRVSFLRKCFLSL